MMTGKGLGRNRFFKKSVEKKSEKEDCTGTIGMVFRDRSVSIPEGIWRVIGYQ
jgi:hypothetical protein